MSNFYSLVSKPGANLFVIIATLITHLSNTPTRNEENNQAASPEAPLIPLPPRTRLSRCTLVTRRSRISRHAGLGVFVQGPPGSRLPPRTFVPFHGVFVALNSPAQFWAPWSLVEYGDMPPDIAFIPDEWDPLPRFAIDSSLSYVSLPH